MEDWKTYKLGEIAEIKGGKRLPRGNQLTSERNSHPYIRVTDMTDKKIPRENLLYVPNEIFPSIKRYIVNSGDVIISIVGTVGLISVIGEDLDNASLTENCAKIQYEKSKLDKSYLYYFLVSKQGQEEIKKGIVGSTQPKLPLYNIKNLEIPVPPIEEQKAIAKILSSLDDKIELNRKMNATLEEMARGVFKAWFVDFEPVHANAENRPSMSASPEIAKLFPAEFQESELGLIPKGWEVESLGNVLELVYGKALKASNRVEGKFPVYGSNGQVGWHDEFLVKEAGIVVGRKGNPGIIKWVDRSFFPIDTTFYVKSKFDLKFIFHLLDNQDLPNLSSDSAVPGLNRNIAYMEKIVMPSARIIETFAELVAGFYKHRSINKRQNANLEEIRDSLLPRLISGKIAVGEIEKEFVKAL